MTRVHLDGYEQLSVELQGWHRSAGCKRSIQVPIAHVRGATMDPGMLDEPKGLRAPGLHLPGVVIGTYHRDGEKHFWDVTNQDRIIVIELVDETYSRLSVDVVDPRATVDAINAAVAPSQESR